MTLFESRLAKVEAVWRDCQQVGWDGAKAAVISRETLEWSARIIASLPDDLECPEACGEPDGMIGMEWHRGKHRLVSLSVGSDGVIHWIACTGEAERRGSIPFAGQLDPEMLDLIRRVVDA